MSKKQQEKIFEPFERLPNAAVEDLNACRMLP